MTPDKAMKVGWEIAERHATVAAMSIREVKPDATVDEVLNGTKVWLAAEIMRALCAENS